MSEIPARLRRLVIRRAADRCEYCGLSQAGQEATFHIDHITPVMAGGPTMAANLLLKMYVSRSHVTAHGGWCQTRGSDTHYDPGLREGELRNMWKPTHQEALWLHGGNLHLSRHYSQYLSLKLKARLEGIPTPVYGLGPVRHTA